MSWRTPRGAGWRKDFKDEAWEVADGLLCGVSWDRWMGNLRTNTGAVSRSVFRGWLRWMIVEGRPFAKMGPDELVAFQGEHRDYQVLDEAQAYVRGMKRRANYKRRVYGAIRSFFLHNREALPQDVFKIQSDIPAVDGRFEVWELQRILASCNVCYRAVFLAMIQGGLGVGELMYWNQNGLEAVREYFIRGSGPLRIALPGRKMNRNIKPYFTFIGDDAVRALKTWMKIRPDTEHTDIFLTKHGTSMKPRTIRWYWNDHVRKLGLDKPTAPKYIAMGADVRTGKNLHELRDFFRTRFQKAKDADSLVAEFCLGHIVDPLGYNKAMKDENYVIEEYQKAVPWLNILSEDPARVPKVKVDAQDKRIADMEEQLRQTTQTLEKILDKVLLEE